MSDITSIAHLHKEFSSLVELQAFAEKQHLTISKLSADLSVAREEISKLKSQLAQAAPLVGQGLVETIIVSPEQALLDDQIFMIQQRSYAKELSLEDVKKLDLLIKNKRMIADDKKDLKGQKSALSNADLLKIVQGNE